MFWVNPPSPRVSQFHNNPINLATVVTFYTATLEYDFATVDGFKTFYLIRFETDHKTLFWYFTDKEDRNRTFRWLRCFGSKRGMLNPWMHENGFNEDALYGERED